VTPEEALTRALARERQQGAKEASGQGTSESPSGNDRALAGHPDARTRALG